MRKTSLNDEEGVTGHYQWSVHVALQSFSGEPWALSCFHRPHTSRRSSSSRSSRLSSCDSVSHSDHGERPKERTERKSKELLVDEVHSSSGNVLRICETGLQSLASGAEADSKSALNDVRQCMEHMRGCNSNNNGALLDSLTNVEFVSLQSTSDTESTAWEGSESALDGNPRYRIQKIEGLLLSTIKPAVSVVVDDCLSAMVLVYGATQEMKQLGVIGTPEECGLLPRGICLLMSRCVEQRERRHQEQQEKHSREFCAGGSTSGAHHFVRAETSFIAIQANSILDLIDLNNDQVELSLQFGETCQGQPVGNHDDTLFSTGLRASTSSPSVFVCHARTMPAEQASNALEALDIGLSNFSRAKEMGQLESEAATSLLFSVTLFTDDCRSATFHVLCLAEDAALQNWIVSSSLACSQALQEETKPDWATIQNVPKPPPLHHNAATLLIPALCFGNMFMSVLVCAYNSMTALSRLSRDLTLAFAGYRMRTMPQTTSVTSQHSSIPLPPNWVEKFTNDGRRYYVEKSGERTIWDDPRFPKKRESKRHSSTTQTQAQVRKHSVCIPLSHDDKQFLDERLQGLCTPSHQNYLSQNTTKQTMEEPPYYIVVVDANDMHKVLVGPSSLLPEKENMLTECNVTEHKLSAKANKKHNPVSPDTEDEFSIWDDTKEEITATDEDVEPRSGSHSTVIVPEVFSNVIVRMTEDDEEEEEEEDEYNERGQVMHQIGEEEDDDNEKDKNTAAHAALLRKESKDPLNDSEAIEDEKEDVQNTKQFYSKVMHVESHPKSKSRISGGADIVETYPQTPVELQELDSLIDEFSRFYREAYEAKKRVKFLEEELAQAQAALQKGKEPKAQTQNEKGNLQTGTVCGSRELHAPTAHREKECCTDCYYRRSTRGTTIPKQSYALLFHQLRDTVRLKGNQGILNGLDNILGAPSAGDVMDEEEAAALIHVLLERVLDHAHNQEEALKRERAERTREIAGEEI